MWFVRGGVAGYFESVTEKEKVRERVRQWRTANAEMDRMRTEDLRAMSERESARIFDMLDPGDLSEVWRRPERLESSGMVEQQRIFMRGHAARG
jgi:hypothetical protein